MKENYCRVIPRDFFNEAKLLKCMGQLALKILDRQTPCEISIKESGKPFEVALLDEGSLTVINYPVTVKGIILTFKTTYNSKGAFPFYCEYDYTDYTVFDDNGNFDDEFINFCNWLPEPVTAKYTRTKNKELSRIKKFGYGV